MKVQDLKDKYNVMKRDGYYHLYSKDEEGVLSPIKYLCSVQKTKTRFNVTDYEPTSNFDKLQEQIKDKLDSYEYNSEFYNPSYREGLFEELVMHEFMQSIGFGLNRYSDGENFELNKTNAYGYKSTNISISIYGLNCFGSRFGGDRGLQEEVSVCLHTTGTSWIESKCPRNVDDMKKTVSSLLKPLTVSDAVNSITLSELLDFDGDVDVLLRKVSGLNITTEDAKQHLKEQLLNIANGL